MVVMGKTKIFLLEEKMPDHKCVLCLVSWFAGSVGFVGFGFKHKLCCWSIYSVPGHVSRTYKQSYGPPDQCNSTAIPAGWEVLCPAGKVLDPLFLEVFPPSWGNS